MISFISGRLTEKTPAFVVIDKGGIGFQVFIPLSTFEKLGNVDDQVELVTYLHVKEDALILFGFSSRGEKELFLHLLSVTGIGPKLAMGILSGVKINEFYQNVANGNESFLTGLKGLGKKTAQRLIIDLKDIAGKKIHELPVSDNLQIFGMAKNIADEAVLALLSLGFSRPEAEKAVSKAAQSSVTTVEELVRIALNS